MGEKIIIETNFMKDGIIEQKTISEFGSNIRKNIIKQIMDTKQEQTKQALIKLGWTPPKG